MCFFWVTVFCWNSVSPERNDKILNQFLDRNFQRQQITKTKPPGLWFFLWSCHFWFIYKTYNNIIINSNAMLTFCIYFPFSFIYSFKISFWTYLKSSYPYPYHIHFVYKFIRSTTFHSYSSNMEAEFHDYEKNEKWRKIFRVC